MSFNYKKINKRTNDSLKNNINNIKNSISSSSLPSYIEKTIIDNTNQNPICKFTFLNTISNQNSFSNEELIRNGLLFNNYMINKIDSSGLTRDYQIQVEVLNENLKLLVNNFNLNKENRKGVKKNEDRTMSNSNNVIFRRRIGANRKFTRLYICKEDINRK